MGSNKFNYFLVWRYLQIPLFESQFKFTSEDQCLRHYEKGLASGLFSLDRPRINQVWSELGLWGLIGRECPTELVRILCAFGCEIAMLEGYRTQVIQKSFQPVTYLIPLTQHEQKHLGKLNTIQIELGSNRYISIFLELDKHLVIGNYYITAGTNVDSQFPKFCKQLESDCCLPHNSIRVCLFKLFWNGYKILAQDQGMFSIIVQRDVKKDILRGLYCEDTLTYLSAT